ncbi:Transglutaminase family protein [Rhodovastum atsumiense]|uniref:Transglutaminase family protein n=1 Tax=Rhodovastum atsumiense TaxID=504468 RepID=A0A5M6IVR2_9PROT|nr:transglutaminase family protein [Rhodovastum atsumiense]KAA5611927.1 transglutaminase family protein [Rhodovastum atsumiense]CAH2598691.1 Transglutaminase family protein [Rhodovastum atsumiense]
MLIRIGYELEYHHTAPTPMVLMLTVHPSRGADLVVPPLLVSDPVVPVETYRDQFGNLCSRLLAPSGSIRFHADGLVADSGLPDPVVADAIQHPVQDLPPETLVFLLGSRYCETDLLSEFAWKTFGNTRPGWSRVQAICDFVHGHLTFGYPFANPRRTAWSSLKERRGVCRDFAHLAIALCRCMNIPARYCTGYLGDIGVPAVPEPMDFSGWFEAFLGGRWHSFDARHNVPRIGRIPIAYGRDAADVAISTTFGPGTLKTFKVWTDEIVDTRQLPAYLQRRRTA